MRNNNLIVVIFLLSAFILVRCESVKNRENLPVKENFNKGWEFVKDIDTAVTKALFIKTASSELSWEAVSLPHTANIEPLVITEKQWQGYCFYRKFFTVPSEWTGKSVVIQFDGAMQVSEVFLNGKYVTKHLGGYLPFVVDISDKVGFDKENCLLVRLNNLDNPIVPPGKPFADLDFCYYSGIYRDVHLVIKDKLQISNSILADRIAGGGIYVSFNEVSEQSATVMVQTDIQNFGLKDEKAKVKLALLDDSGREVSSAEAPEQEVGAGKYTLYSQKFLVDKPHLWSPDNPYLYTLTVKVLKHNEETDIESIKIGIRSFSFSSSGGFVLNGSRLQIYGTNRHQEYPYIGNALSNNAQYRDAYKIKEAGFNFVRCSHYPQATAFLDACDELGILVMDATPGWQFFGNTEFQENSISDIRNMIRRDRNHASVILWEASLNETDMEEQFIKRAHMTVKEELPYSENYSAGWVDSIYDVFLPARQHASPPYYWNRFEKNIPFMIAEYGDWEYYANNAGFNQKEFADLTARERNSRQLRKYGQKRLLQQALNYQESHNSNLGGPAIGDANWLIFDYNRGYAPDIEASGIMDIFRIPKFAFYLYKSQRSYNSDTVSGFDKPVLFIANYWNDPSLKTIKVFSNCDEVELILNGQFIARQKPDNDLISGNLTHPPFTFETAEFAPGTLLAYGYIHGEKVMETTITTPGLPSQIRLNWDKSGRNLKAGCNDMVFVYASVTDKSGTIIPEFEDKIKFEVKGNVSILGPDEIAAEAGIATVLIKAGNDPGAINITAKTPGLEPQTIQITTMTN